MEQTNETIFANIEFGEREGGIAGALLGGKLWLAFLLVFVGGIATSLTPCVYPLIPITVSIFGANESTCVFKSFLLSVVLRSRNYRYLFNPWCCCSINWSSIRTGYG